MGEAVIHSYLFDINFDTPLAERPLARVGGIFDNYLDKRNFAGVDGPSVDCLCDNLVIIRPVPILSVFNLKEGLVH